MRFLAVLLFPIALLYDLVTRFRNHLYNVGYKRSFSFQTNVIAVGNLSVGGTGKTPMVEYIVRLLRGKYHITTLSRGYGRRTKGYRLAHNDDTAKTIGDEPFQFYNKFKDINVAVCEERALGIPFILVDRPETEVILLDDAFQHRSVKPQLNLMLTDFNNLFYNDLVLPVGRLRESRKGASRADIIIVTKCPKNEDQIPFGEIQDFMRKYNAKADVFFSGIKYGSLIPFEGAGPLKSKLIVFSGLASSRNFVEHLRSNYEVKEHFDFNDHHMYSPKEIKKLLELSGDECSLITTEKDMVKLIQPQFKSLLRDKSIYYLTIESYFLKDGKRFDSIIQNSILQYSN
ncbi:MAG: tetraacyldisaccharide 4'-kinase [Bacteroidota bacterium]